MRGTDSAGHLVIIGGHEDKTEVMSILKRFVELSGGPDSKIVVISAASKIAEKMWESYDAVFADLGVKHRIHVRIESRADAGDPEKIQQVRDADGIFITGGDQKRLLANIGGTQLDRALHAAFEERGACIGGTSAGASAMSGHMLASGQAGLQPEKGAVGLGAGLGLVRGVIIDQHFSERHRLSRLLTVIAANPYLMGIGIDEDTALIVERGVGIEVLGHGAVTIVDGRAMLSTMADAESGACPELIDVRLHLLPNGSGYNLARGSAPGNVPAPLRNFLHAVTQAHIAPSHASNEHP